MKTYVPTNSMRNNVLSVLPGGSIVKVVFESHEVVYDKIKNPSAYIAKILRENKEVTSIDVNGTRYWTRK